MTDILHVPGNSTDVLRRTLHGISSPFAAGSKVGIKLHWGERGNKNFLHPQYAREIVRWLQESGIHPFVFDTTVLYSGGRRTGADSLKTAAEHGFTEEYLGCPVRIGDGMDGRDVFDLPGLRHFSSIQAAAIVRKADGFVIFSHFKGHMESSFGGAVKNIAMGMASRAQKQRMHADAHPTLNPKACNQCGFCVEVCPTGAATLPPKGRPVYDLKRCVGCSQCIALCPQAALKVFWDTDIRFFQERLVETAAAIWKRIGARTVIVNALIQIVAECDCMPGSHRVIAPDCGFVIGRHPVTVDEESMKLIGARPFDSAHKRIPWKRQFAYAREIGFLPALPEAG
ncbi:MAG: DUF362 domain-containing protein [Deltaproteobacteria bacterium]|nr:DUF362 domain-containing protein [Deltaproteobacteria bacterium]